MGVQGITGINMGQLILQLGGQEWEAPGEQEVRCWAEEHFTEEVTFEESQSKE